MTRYIVYDSLSTFTLNLCTDSVQSITRNHTHTHHTSNLILKWEKFAHFHIVQVTKHWTFIRSTMNTPRLQRCEQKFSLFFHSTPSLVEKIYKLSGILMEIPKYYVFVSELGRIATTAIIIIWSINGFGKWQMANRITPLMFASFLLIVNVLRVRSFYGPSNTAHSLPPASDNAMVAQPIRAQFPSLRLFIVIADKRSAWGHNAITAFDKLNKKENKIKHWKSGKRVFGIWLDMIRQICNSNECASTSDGVSSAASVDIE